MRSLNPELELVRADLGAMAQNNRSETVEALRANMDERGGAYGLPEGCDVETVSQFALATEWLRPREATAGCIVMYLHGGGYGLGSPRSHRHLAAQLAAEAGVTALNVGYRLAPENPFPAALDDALAHYGWLLDQGFEPGRIVVAGDSAGAGLALSMALSLSGAGLPQPAGLYLISPWLDLSCRGAAHSLKAARDPMLTTAGLVQMADNYRGAEDVHHPLISPVNSDLTGLPPLLLQAGSDDILLTDATLLAERAGLAGVRVTLEIWPDMFHVWPIFHERLDEARQAINDAARWISARQASAPASWAASEIPAPTG